MEGQEVLQERIESQFEPDNEIQEPSEGVQTETKVEESPMEGAPDGAPDIASVLSEIKESIASLNQNMVDIKARYEEKIANDEYKNQLFDKMYQELALYKKDLYAKLMSPFINETITLIADYERIISKLDTYEPERVAKYLRGIPDDLMTMLENNAVEQFQDDGEIFNPKCQRALRSIPTDKIEDNNKISEHIHVGYRWNGVILKPEVVTVWRYQETSTVTEKQVPNESSTHINE